MRLLIWKNIYKVLIGNWNAGTKNAIIEKTEGAKRMEKTLSGYCRTIDDARIVLLDPDEKEPEIGCDYAGCAFRDSCPIGQQITALLKESGGSNEERGKQK